MKMKSHRKMDHYRSVLFSLLLFVSLSVGSNEFVDCENDQSISCYGIHIVRKVVSQIIESRHKDIEITEGVHLVETSNHIDGQTSSAEGRSATPDNDGSLSGTIEKYLVNHELRIKLPEIIPPEGVKTTLKTVMEDFSNRSLETGRKGGGGGGGGGGGKKGGGGAILLMGMMMAKVLGAIGFGAVGLLAMKALMVSALALMLSAIIGIKKLASSGHDEGGHQVIYAGGHGHEHHRKRRHIENDLFPLPYRGWTKHAQN